MSVEFSSDPIDFADFDGYFPDNATGGLFPFTPHLVDGIGCSGDVIFTCSNTSSGQSPVGVYKTRAADTDTITVRAQASFYHDTNPAAPSYEAGLFDVQTKVNPPNDLATNTVSLSVLSTGAVRLTAGALSSLSSAGLVPITGNPVALQLSLDRSGVTTIAADVGVEGVSVFTHTFDFGATTFQFGRTYVLVNRFPSCGNYPPPGFTALDPDFRFNGYVTGMTGISSVEVDSTASIDAGYVACSGATALTLDTCWQPASVTSLSLNFATSELTITGTKFYGGEIGTTPMGTTPGVFIIFGPGGGQILFTIISTSRTQYVVLLTQQYDEDFNLTPFTPVAGTYCVQFITPCS